MGRLTLHLWGVAQLHQVVCSVDILLILSRRQTQISPRNKGIRIVTSAADVLALHECSNVSLW